VLLVGIIFRLSAEFVLALSQPSTDYSPHLISLLSFSLP
jgi:hypothetical protein